MKAIRIVFVLVALAGCSFSPSIGDITCEDEGATTDGKRCEGGLWVLYDAGVPDGGAEDGGGIDEPDASDAPDTASPDAACEPESDASFCERLQKQCGTVEDVDNCGSDRQAECGVCDREFEACDADNVCTLQAESDQELCDAADAMCGEIMVTDRTGSMRTPDCGMCSAGLECGLNTGPNQCGCENADDAQFCLENGDPECGAVTALDPSCGVERTVNCGTCSSPETCGGGGVSNECGCIETDVEFCARLGFDCGPVTADDLCGVSRTTDCGTCTLPETCGGGPTGMQGVCGCDVDDACAAVGSECGMTDVSGMCDNLTAVDCGTCGASGVCGLATNTCACDAGYAYDGTACADIDECTSGAAQCDANAACTNTAGSYDCDCLPPYTGDGFTCQLPAPAVIEEIEEDTASTFTSPSTPTMTGVDDHLYVALISIRTESREVTGVNGLGLTWQRADEHCDGEDGQVLEVWWAQGNTSGDSSIDVDLSDNPFASTIVVYRISGAAMGAPTVSIRNRNGVGGSCGNGGTDSGYSYDYTPQSASSLILVGTAIRDAGHAEGAIWTEDRELHRRGSGEEAGIATMHYTNMGTAPITVDGALNPDTDWVSAVVEVAAN